MRAKKSTSEECQVGCPIRRSRDQRLLSSPPGLSQSATSFIASHRQGIHQTPFSRLIRSRRRTIVLRNSQLQPANASAITGLGQCIDLERLFLVVLSASAYLRTGLRVLSPSGYLRTRVAPLNRQRRRTPRTWSARQKRLVFLSLHDVKRPGPKTEPKGHKE